jgi:predicted MFS family arabinose efflux permease
LAWTPLLQDKGFHLQTIGYLFSLISIFGVIFPIIIGKIIPRNKHLSGLIIVSVFYAILLIFAGLLGQIFVLAAIFVIISSLEEIYLPLEETVINVFAKSGHRATLLSVKSVVESLSSIVGGPLAGLIIILVGKQTSILLSGILFTLIPICYLFAYNRNKKAATLS